MQGKKQSKLYKKYILIKNAFTPSHLSKLGRTFFRILKRDGFIVLFKRLNQFVCGNLITFFSVGPNFKKRHIIKDVKEIKGLISVIIPVFDRTIELDESINSILNQTYKKIELIIVTDGSPQETISVVEKYRKNSKVKIFHYYNNTGNAVRGRNKGIKEARGEFVAFQDSDDIAEKNRLEKSLHVIREKKVDVVYGGWRALMDGTRKIKGIENGQEIIDPDCDFYFLKRTCVPCQSTVMVRRKALLDVGGLKTKMHYREDHELWLRLAYHGYTFKSINAVLTNLRLHKGNNELNFKDDDRKWRKRMLSEYKNRAILPKKIVYIIPGTGISGGIAIILQHANRLLERGHDVCIVTQDCKTKLDWFPNNKVTIITENTKHKYLLENIDILIATGWSTVFSMKNIFAKRKVYFVQSDERRFFPDEKLKIKIHGTYLTNCEYMTEALWIQRWLKDEFGHDAYYVPNGIDEKIIYKTSSLVKKNEKDIRVLIEGPISVPFKAMDDAYNAIKDLDCKIWIVSSDGRPKKRWRYDRFFEKVPYNEMKQIYSSCDIFLKMSRVEGFFGPPMEAMACGCAVVVSKCTGYDEYIENEKNALVVEMGDVEGAKKAVQMLIENPQMRDQLIKNGYRTVKQWDWERSIDLLEKMIHQDPVHVYYTEEYPEKYCYDQEIAMLKTFQQK